MGKPPPDVDPDKFILGDGWHTNFKVARPYHDDCVFRIDPAPMAASFFVFFNLLILAVACGFIWALKHLMHVQEGP